MNATTVKPLELDLKDPANFILTGKTQEYTVMVQLLIDCEITPEHYLKVIREKYDGPANTPDFTNPMMSADVLNEFIRVFEIDPMIVERAKDSAVSKNLLNALGAKRAKMFNKPK